MDLVDLTKRQRFSLWLEGRDGLTTEEMAERFLADVTIALRYGATDSIPMASMFRATQRQVPVPEAEAVAHRRAFELTNRLLASGRAIEVNIIADRLVLAHPRVMPALYQLRRGKRGPRDGANLSSEARQTFHFIQANQGATAGDVRRLFGIAGQRRPDPADLALAELQRDLLIDRGPSSVPTKGIFYLSKEGYLYRVLDEAHSEIAPAARTLSRQEAAARLLGWHLEAAVFAPVQKLRKMFELLLTAAEIDQAIAHLMSNGTLDRVRLQRGEAVVVRDAADRS